MPEYVFPSYGYYEALREDIESCSYIQLKERLALAERSWSHHGLIEQYVAQLSTVQAATQAELRLGIAAFEKLTYGQVRWLVNNLERIPIHHV